MSPLFRLRMAYGMRWRRSYWVPCAKEVLLTLLTILAALAVYLAVAAVLIEERRADAAEKQASAEAMLLGCLNDRIVFHTPHIGIRCRPIEVPI